MSATDKILGAIKSAIVLSDRVERLTSDLKIHDGMIRNLNDRMVRLETLAGAPRGLKKATPRLERKGEGEGNE